jgi:hypothetical protein
MDPDAIVIEPENGLSVSYRNGDTNIKVNLEIIMHGVSHYDAILGQIRDFFLHLLKLLS